MTVYPDAMTGRMEGCHLQTLFEMKHPQPVAFVKQANIANGPQQVNNGAATQAPPHAGISAN